jgi:hypothetical protein
MDKHVQKQTMRVEVNVPPHDPRINQKLFERTRKQLIARDRCCFICGVTSDLQAHHYPIEWSLALMIDWSEGATIRKDFPNFKWAGFDPTRPYPFVDNMLFNGLLLCQRHHIEVGTGIHTVPHPIWIAQRYGKEGYVFNQFEVIHHASS